MRCDKCERIEEGVGKCIHKQRVKRKECHRLLKLSVAMMSNKDEIFRVPVVQATKGCLCDYVMSWMSLCLHKYILHGTMVIRDQAMGNGLQVLV